MSACWKKIWIYVPSLSFLNKDAPRLSGGFFLGRDFYGGRRFYDHSVSKSRIKSQRRMDGEFREFRDRSINAERRMVGGTSSASSTKTAGAIVGRRAFLISARVWKSVTGRYSRMHDDPLEIEMDASVQEVRAMRNVVVRQISFAIWIFLFTFRHTL